MTTMNQTVPTTMQAAAIDRFGGSETLSVRTLPVPQVEPDEVLIRVEAAGVGSWDRGEREGHYSDYLGAPTFPYVLGWDGSGTIAAIGERVSSCKLGDHVYAATFPKRGGGGFYAEYAAVRADYVWHVPRDLTSVQAGVMGWDVLTALSGLDDILSIKPDEKLLVFGASGGIGHMAVQLAKRMGARVLAVASGDDGVALATRQGADAVVDGRRQDALAAARSFAPNGLDACLITAGGEMTDRTLQAVRNGGRIAYPKGVTPKPVAPSGASINAYDGIRSQEAAAKLSRLIGSGAFEIHVARTFRLDQVAEAHRTLENHFLGKLALLPNQLGNAR
jgi:NADPH2:quinone reductase